MTISINGGPLYCHTCGELATTYLGWAGRAPRGGCDTHPVGAATAAAGPFGSFSGYVPVWTTQSPICLATSGPVLPATPGPVTAGPAHLEKT